MICPMNTAAVDTSLADSDDHGHVPVLAEATFTHLAPAPSLTVFDGTLGRGGHASMLIPHLTGGTYIATDLDADNLAHARARLMPLAAAHDVTLHLHHASFTEAPDLLRTHKLKGVDRLLADLGFASNQVDQPERGLSFMQDGPLDMRLNRLAGLTAADLINDLPERELADIIWRFGEERASRRIAQKVVAARAVKPITTTGVLAQLCRDAYGPAAHRQRIHPATRTFQALRIAVSGELDALDTLLASLQDLLRPDGLAGIISFHSLEDRPVKHGFRQADAEGWGEVLTRKPVIATEAEARQNPRSRSAKLRVLKKEHNHCHPADRRAIAQPEHPHPHNLPDGCRHPTPRTDPWPNKPKSHCCSRWSH